MEMFKEFIKPELLILIPVLNLVGYAIKNSPVKDWKIPYILGLCGVLLSAFYLVATSPIPDMGQMFWVVFSAVTQGVLCAGVSVYFNQLAKQAGNAKED